VKVDHVVRKVPAKFVDPRNQGLEVIPVLDTGGFRYLLDPLSFEADQVQPEDGLVICITVVGPMTALLRPEVSEGKNR
jgi:hypothetical protein